MRTVSMSLPILEVPRLRIPSLAISCWQSFHGWSGRSGNVPSLRLLGSQKGLEGGYSKRWIRKSVTTKTSETNKNTVSLKPSSIKHEILGGVSTDTTLNVNRTNIDGIHKVQYCDIQQIAQKKDLSTLVTVLVFDIETTGLSRDNERIIEIALQDLSGGENSTFQTLVNPDRYVANSNIHGITTQMVSRPDVPRMKDLIPILLQYIKSRQKPGGYVMLVAHNGRCFDFPFLLNEFSRCSYDLPFDWMFLDTIHLARELVKSGGLQSPGLSLQALRESYGIPSTERAHRAMADVNVLSLIFQRLTFGLKLSLSGCVERCVTGSHFINSKKKKNSG